jgi:hypothetical protein
VSSVELQTRTYTGKYAHSFSQGSNSETLKRCLLPYFCSCKHGGDPSGSVEGGEFLDWLGDCWLLKRDSAPWSYSNIIL